MTVRTSTIEESLLQVGRPLAITDSVVTLGPAGTSSEAAAWHLWGRYGPAEAAMDPDRVVLLDTYEQCLAALRRGKQTVAVVANAYSGASQFYMDPDVDLWGAFVLDTPRYGIASATPFVPSGSVRLVTHPAPAPLVGQLFPGPVDRLELVFASSTSSAAREVRVGRADLALTTEKAAALHQLHFVSRTRTIRMLWSVFRSTSADAVGPIRTRDRRAVVAVTSSMST
jgi:prephenate dehydratase